MTFWLLALVLLASLAGIGYRQGSIRVAFSLVGILVGALLAGPLGKVVKPLLVVLGLRTPPLAWLLAPLVVFVMISIIFKVAALVVHRKVEVHFRYHAGDLRQVLWERLNGRLGLCLALVNGALYLILLSSVIYPLSYWTVQMATEDKDAKEDKDPKTMRILNRLGEDLQSTGFAKVARAVDRMPQVWYDSADLAGLIYKNPLSEARLARYPAFLSLAERPEFQDMANDTQFTVRLGADSRPLELQPERHDEPVPAGQAEHLLQRNVAVEEMDAGGVRQDQPGGDDRSPGHSQEYAPAEAAGGWRRSSQRTPDLEGPVEGPGWQVSTRPFGRKQRRTLNRNN
jgi:hypothetical protein